MTHSEVDLQERLDTPLASTTLALRTVNLLESHGLLLVSDLLQCCGRPHCSADCPRYSEIKPCIRKHLPSIAGLGDKALQDIYRTLALLRFHRT